jgi:hypothetical protein
MIVNWLLAAACLSERLNEIISGMLIAVEGLHPFGSSLQVFRCAPFEEPIIPCQAAR